MEKKYITNLCCFWGEGSGDETNPILSSINVAGLKVNIENTL